MIRYIGREELLEINTLFGYNGLIRDENLLMSALAAPKDAAYYENADLVRQATILVERIVLNYLFVDGNKRTGAVAGSTLLVINRLHIRFVDEDEELTYAKEIEKLVVTKDFERFLARTRLSSPWFLTMGMKGAFLLFWGVGGGT
jgi:death-on-curing protein